MSVGRRVLGLSVLCLAMGCGYGTTGDNPVEVAPTVTPAKAMFEEIAKTGQLGSSGMDIRNAIEGHPKQTQLMEDLQDLEKTSRPDQIKKKAAAIAAKL